MKNPSGLGEWSAFANMHGGHESAPDRLAACGAKWVAPRGGHNVWRDKYWQELDAPKHIERYHTAGFGVYVWFYVYPSSWQKAVPILKAFKDEGADGVILDCEVEWDNGCKDTAKAMMASLDKELGSDYFIADAPWPYPNYHPNFPYAEFAERVQMRMPQAYWTENSNRGALYHMPQYDAAWAKWDADNPSLVRPICPIGVTYGDDLKGASKPPPGKLLISDMIAFTKRYRSRPCYSFYSMELMDQDEAAAVLAASNDFTEYPPASYYTTEDAYKVPENIQQKLISLGYDVGPTGADGILGKASIAAIKQFQLSKGLTPDGIVGSKTAAALAAA